ncbi:MAG: PIG-L family deacetylase [Clostridia bacterium]|nr:PIG-L family deacetylase [Clostridia bacterium]
MKKLLALCLLLLLCMICASAEPARDITDECTFQMPYIATKLKYMTDRNYETVTESKELLEPNLLITPGETPVAGVYVEFGKSRLPFFVQVKEGKEWVTIASGGGYYAQEYVAFQPQEKTFRLKFITNGHAECLRISEITLLSPGEIDRDKIHIWHDTVGKADLMITVAHPDDELLWLGGCIPYYAAERNMNVLVTYLTCGKSCRELELLNGLWHCGVRHYPAIAYLPDFKAYNAEAVYERWDRSQLYQYLVRLIREHKPEVIVTHDFKGEYGHAQHVACAYSTLRAVEYAVNPEYNTNSANEYGTWQVKKLYVHLGEEYTTFVDWHQPLKAFEGKSGFEIACEAYQMHISQMDGSTYYDVADRGTDYDSFIFTLVQSTVGMDVKGGDLFENIQPEDLTSTYYKFE